MFTLDFLAVTLSRDGKVVFPALESYWCFCCGGGIYHILASFVYKRTFQCLPTVLFPQGKAILFFSMMFKTENTKQMELLEVIFLPTRAMKECETSMSKRNQELSVLGVIRVHLAW